MEIFAGDAQHAELLAIYEANGRPDIVYIALGGTAFMVRTDSGAVSFIEIPRGKWLDKNQRDGRWDNAYGYRKDDYDNR